MRIFEGSSPSAGTRLGLYLHPQVALPSQGGVCTCGPVEGDASAVERLRGSEVVIDCAALAIAQAPSNNHTWQTCKRCLMMFSMKCSLYNVS